MAGSQRSPPWEPCLASSFSFCLILDILGTDPVGLGAAARCLVIPLCSASHLTIVLGLPPSFLGYSASTRPDLIGCPYSFSHPCRKHLSLQHATIPKFFSEYRLSPEIFLILLCPPLPCFLQPRAACRSVHCFLREQ